MVILSGMNHEEHINLYMLHVSINTHRTEIWEYMYLHMHVYKYLHL